MINKFPKKVMLLDKWEGTDKTDRAVHCRVACDCGGSDCDVHLDIEYDRELNMVFLEFWKDVYFFDIIRDSEATIDKIKNILYRIRKAIRLVFTGYLKMNEDFVLQEEEHIDNFIQIMQDAKEFVKSGKDDL
jgi:hypothetical protein